MDPARQSSICSRYLFICIIPCYVHYVLWMSQKQPFRLSFMVFLFLFFKLLSPFITWPVPFISHFILSHSVTCARGAPYVSSSLDTAFRDGFRSSSIQTEQGVISLSPIAGRRSPMKYAKIELVLRKSKIHDVKREYHVKSSTDAYDFATRIMRMHEMPEEHFCIITLNAKGDIIGYSEISKGSLSSAEAHPREMFKTTMLRM